MSNALKKVTLYKNQIPFQSDAHSCFYFTFGHFCGMDIQGVEDTHSKYGMLDKVFNNRLVSTTEKKSDYNSQEFFIFREENDSIELFWKDIENGKSKFLIVSFLHLKCSIININKTRETIDTILNEIGNGAFESHAYSTFNNCDYVVFTKTNNYEIAIKSLVLLDEHLTLADGAKVSYSYTILAIPCFNNKSDEILKEEFSNIVFKSLHIQFMSKNYFKLSKLLSEVSKSNDIDKDLINQIEKNRLILGSDDFMIHLTNLSFYEFLKLFAKNGIFHRENKEFIAAVNAINIHIEMKPPTFQEHEMIPDSEYHWTRDQQALMQALYENESKGLKLSQKECYYALSKILHNLKPLEFDDISNYSYNCITYPLKMYIERIRSVINKNQILEFSARDLYLALECMNTIFMSSTISDIHAFQRPVNSTPLFDIPGKLLSFYTGFTFFLMHLLRSYDEIPGFHYAFLMNVQLQYKMSVEIIFEDQEPCDRLLLVNMPVYHLYNPRNLLLSVAHEVSHIVGEDSRKRELRTIYLLNAISDTIANVLTKEIFKKNLIEDEFKDDIYNTFYSRLNTYVKNELKLIQSEKRKDKYKDYSYYLRKDVEAAYIHVIFKYRDELLESILDSYYNKKMVKEGLNVITDDIMVNRFALRDRINELSNLLTYKFQFLFAGSGNSLNIKIKKILIYFKECYADLVMVMILRPSFKEYAENFEYNIQGNKMIMKDDLLAILRISCIFKLIYNEDEDAKKELDELDNNLKNKIEEVSTSKMKRVNKEGFDIHFLFITLYQYLQECYRELSSKEDYFKDILESFRSIYTKCDLHVRNMVELDDLLDIVNKFNIKFKKYNKAALLYGFEIKKSIKDISNNKLEKVELEGANIHYLPINGLAYCMNLESCTVAKVYIEEIDYSNKEKRIVSFKMQKIMSDLDSEKIINLFKLQQELDNGKFDIKLE